MAAILVKIFGKGSSQMTAPLQLTQRTARKSSLWAMMKEIVLELKNQEMYVHSHLSNILRSSTESGMVCVWNFIV